MGSVITADLRHEQPHAAAGQQDARGGEHAGLKRNVGVGKFGDHGEGARTGIDGGIDGRHAPLKNASGVAGNHGFHGHEIFICGALASGTCNSRRMGVISSSVAIFEVTATYWPTAMGRALM